MRARIISMLLTGLILAIIFLAVVQLTQSVGKRVAPNGSGDQLRNDQDRLESILPIIVRSVSESEGVLTITGTSHSEANLDIESFGQVISNISSNEEGEWRVTIPVQKDDAHQIELVQKVGSNLPTRSDEKIHRIPVPKLDIASPDLSPRALLMSTAPGGPSSIFQSPFRGLPSSGAISMGSIDYDESGGVIFSGASEKDGRVRIFANETVIGERQVFANGRWYIIAPDTLPRGEFTIRARLITTEGTDSEISVDFNRLTARDGDSTLDFEVFYEPYTWQIRRALRGGGFQYTAIFAPSEADPIIQQ